VPRLGGLGRVVARGALAASQGDYLAHARRGRRAVALGGGAAHSTERGSVTAEIAVALPALVLVITVALWGVSAAAAQVACVDAARAGARAAARGEPMPAVQAAVLRGAPAGARVTARRDSDLTEVEVVAEVRAPAMSGLPPIVVREHAVAATEPGRPPQ
jgi:hypothetical protein